MAKQVIIEVPHRISGFFEIVDEIKGTKIENPEHIGSRGAGFNLTAVGKTEISIEDLDKGDISQCIIKINKKEVNEKAETTTFIFDSIKQLINNPVKIRIDHYFDLPVGCGYGASGAGALGAVLGLDKILNLNLGILEKGRIAHIAEVVNRTGLGTVCGQLAGGLCMLKEPGYPCTFEIIPFPKDLSVICGTFGMIHTKSILMDPLLNKKIKQAGRNALKKLISEPSVHTFMKASINFVEETKILDILNLNEVKELMDGLNQLNIIGACMNQLGRSVYAICRKKQEEEVSEVFQSFKPDIKIFHSSINKQGPLILRSE